MIFNIYSVVKKVLTDMQCKVCLSEDSLVTWKMCISFIKLSTKWEN